MLNADIPSFKALVRKSYFTKNKKDLDVFLNVYVFGQTRNSNKSEDPIYYENKFKEYGVDFQIGNDYERYNPSHRTVVPTYKQISCMSYGLYSAIVNKKYKNHYVE